MPLPRLNSWCIEVPHVALEYPWYTHHGITSPVFARITGCLVLPENVEVKVKVNVFKRARALPKWMSTETGKAMHAAILAVGIFPLLVLSALGSGRPKGPRLCL